MSNIAIGIPIFFLILLLFLAVPLFLGVYVYRDAKRRGLNAVLWTLISILAPGFVGLIIYLIIRSEHSDLRCRSCNNTVKPSFAVCPYCGASLKEHCPVCGFTLEAGWVKCPECGEDIPEELRQSRQNSTKKDNGLKGILLAVLLIPLAICVLMFLAMCSFGFHTGRGSSASSMAISSIDEMDAPAANAEMLREWVDECDAAGPGAYILKAEDNHYYENGNHITAFLLYCNNGYYIAGANTSMGGWFTDATTEFSCLPGDEEGLPFFMFYEYISDEPSNPRVLCGDKAVDVKVTDVDWSYFSDFSSYYYSNMYIEVNVDESAEQVYSVHCDFYAGEEITMGEGATNANGTTAAGDSFYFTFPLDEYDDITAACISASNKDGEVIFTESFSIADHPSWTVNIMTDENGELAAKMFENN